MSVKNGVARTDTQEGQLVTRPQTYKYGCVDVCTEVCGFGSVERTLRDLTCAVAALNRG